MNDVNDFPIELKKILLKERLGNCFTSITQSHLCSPSPGIRQNSNTGRAARPGSTVRIRRRWHKTAIILPGRRGRRPLRNENHCQIKKQAPQLGCLFLELLGRFELPDVRRAAAAIRRRFDVLRTRSAVRSPIIQKKRHP